VPIEETIAKLDQIDAAAVRRFGERILQGSNPSIAAVGPISQLEKHTVFARRFGSERSIRAANSPAARPRHSSDGEPLAAAELAKAE
jgi:predicted Zn-dependent peptidase